MRPLAQRPIQAASVFKSAGRPEPASLASRRARLSTSSKSCAGRQAVVNAPASSFADYGVPADARYVSQYRDAAKYESAPVYWAPSSSMLASSSPRSSYATSAAQSTPPTAPLTSSSMTHSKAASSESQPEVHSPVRRRRHEMESAWGATPDPSFAQRVIPRAMSSGPSAGKARKTALLFPGSGSQYVGMGQFLIDNFKTARDVWAEAEEALSTFEKWRKDLKLHELEELRHLDLLNWKTWKTERGPKELLQIVQNGPQDELTRSSNAQPAILITSIALLRTLEKEFGTPISQVADYFAGHSSGEYSATVAAGVINFQEGVKLTRLHGLLTSRTLQLSSLKTYSDHEATDEERAQMSALILHPNASPDDVKRIVRQVRESRPGNAGMVEVASYNSSAQIILSGSRAGVLEACDELHENDIASRAADLPVFAPFHCSFMSPAAHGMAYAWNHGVTAKAPRAPIVSNLDAGLITTAERLKSDIVASIHEPVLWSQGLDLMRNMGVSRYVFVGPGKALANLAKKETKTGRWQDFNDVQLASVATHKDMDEVSELCKDLATAASASQEARL